MSCIRAGVIVSVIAVSLALAPMLSSASVSSSLLQDQASAVERVDIWENKTTAIHLMDGEVITVKGAYDLWQGKLYDTRRLKGAIYNGTSKFTTVDGKGITLSGKWVKYVIIQ